MALTNIYKGIAFPFSVGDGALPAPAVDDALIKDTLTQLIITGNGERVMRPDLGSGAYSYVFESNNELMAAAIRASIANVIAKYEPRVIVQRIDVEKDSSDGKYEDMVIVTINYVVIATQEQDNVTVALTADQGVV